VCVCVCVCVSCVGCVRFVQCVFAFDCVILLRLTEKMDRESLVYMAKLAEQAER
jgi:hypothetical protein